MPGVFFFDTMCDLLLFLNKRWQAQHSWQSKAAQCVTNCWVHPCWNEQPIPECAENEINKKEKHATIAPLYSSFDCCFPLQLSLLTWTQAIARKRLSQSYIFISFLSSKTSPDFCKTGVSKLFTNNLAISSFLWADIQTPLSDFTGDLDLFR